LSSVFWKKLLILVSLMVLILSISGLYNLTFYFIPLIYFLSDKEPRRLDLVYVIFFAMLFFPKQYFFVPIGINLFDSNTIITNIIAICFATVLLVDCFTLKFFAGKFSFRKASSADSAHLLE
jgi:hypothetical protein